MLCDDIPLPRCGVAVGVDAGVATSLALGVLEDEEDEETRTHFWCLGPYPRKV